MDEPKVNTEIEQADATSATRNLASEVGEGMKALAELRIMQERVADLEAELHTARREAQTVYELADVRAVFLACAEEELAEIRRCINCDICEQHSYTFEEAQ